MNMIGDFEYLIHGLNRSFDEMISACQEKNQMEFGYRLGNCLHWLIICRDRLDINEKSIQHEILEGLKFANNCLKHNKRVFALQEMTGGFKIPAKFPTSFGIIYVWAPLEVNRNKYQMDKYNKYFKGKSITDTIQTQYQILQNLIAEKEPF
jgi:hypothetical protein